MKKLLFLAATAATGCFFSFTALAQTGDEIVAKYISAIGGKDKISAVQTLYMEGSMNVMGNDAPVTVYQVNGKGYKSEMEFNGSKIIQCITDKGGWMMNPMMGGFQEIPAEQLKSNRDQIYIGGALLDYKANGATVDFVKKDGNSNVVKYTDKDKNEKTYYFDANTGYLTKLVQKGNAMGQEVEITISMSDYKKTDAGYVMPYSMNTDLGQFSLAMTITKVEVNKAIDPSIFDAPKQ